MALHDLDDVVACGDAPAVSIYLPTHPAGREIRQDPIRLRTMLAAAGGKLSAGRRPAQVAALLEPASRLIDDAEFWRQPTPGLAVFLAPRFDWVRKLPIAVPEELVVADHFAIRPLLPLFDRGDRYWVLTISAGQTRLFRGSRWDCSELSGVGLPQGVADVRGESEYEAARGAAPTGRPSRGPAGLARAQALGPTPAELHKAQLIEHLHRVATAAEAVIQRHPAPVILAAVPEIEGNFRALARWKTLLPDGIRENPDAMSVEVLHRKTWRLFAPREEQARADALGQLMSLLGNGGNRATAKAEEIVKAARWGRIDRLYLADGAPLWGRFDEQKDQVTAHGRPADGDEDLFDYAALMTLRHGGTVMLVDRGQLPEQRMVAAILRF